MPCDRVAVVTATVRVNTKLILESEPALQVIAQALAEAAGISVSSVSHSATATRAQWSFYPSSSLVMQADGALALRSSRYGNDLLEKARAAITKAAGILTQQALAAVVAQQHTVVDQVYQQDMLVLTVEL